MLISCLTVTQPSRYEHLQRAVHCFQNQTWPDKQLVVVVDGDDDYCQRLQAYFRDVDIDVKVSLAQGKTLGDKRNETVAAADGDLLCYWDDDDQYHRDRLVLQARGLTESGADFCYLSGFLHYFNESGELSWIDWRRDGDGKFHPDSPPFRAFPSTMLAHKDRMLPYPSTSNGEDSMFLSYATIRRAPIHVMEGYGWCFLYCYHGDNLFPHSHHQQVNRVRGRRLDDDEVARTVARMKREYDPGFSLPAVLSQYQFQQKKIQLQTAVAETSA